MQVIFKGIKWDTDGQNVPELPTEFVVECDTPQQAKIIADDMDISNVLSDDYGFCVDSIGSIEVYDDDGAYLNDFGNFVNEVEGKVS